MAFRATSLRRLAEKLTDAERTKVLRDANEKMRQYYVNRPPLSALKKKKKFGDGPRDTEHMMQFVAVSSFLVAFLLTPFLGRRIAQDDDFRKRFIPEWYDFTIEKPDYAVTRAEMHEQLVELQQDLHERAIRGEFTPEKLEEMRRHFAGVDPQNDPHGWGKLHPGVDDDEDIEDD